MAQLTYEQIAQRLGISQARVRQIEEKALAKMLAGLKKKGVTASDVRTLPARDCRFKIHQPSGNL